MPFLKQHTNGALANIVEIRDGCTIGRALENAISVDDPTVSMLHAQILLDGDQWYIEDRGSTNGIQLKGGRTERAELKEGDTFSIGIHSFSFMMSAPQNFDQTLKIKKSWIPGVFYTK